MATIHERTEEYWQRCADPLALETLKFWRGCMDAPSFVYFVQEEERGTVKIGTALDPIGRLGELQGGNPDELVIRRLVFGTRQLERELHRHWLDAHVYLEWFGEGYQEAIFAFADEIGRRQREMWGRGTIDWERLERVLWDIQQEQAA